MNALWWWIDRWRKSTAYMDMTLEQQGAYRNLLDEANLRGGPLPTDERVLAKACGDAKAWRRVRAVVMARFTLMDDGWRQSGYQTTRAPQQPRIGPRLRRPDIPMWIRRLVVKRDGSCRFCGSADLLEIDHIVRKREGGPDTPDNLRVLCRPCNRRRG